MARETHYAGISRIRYVKVTGRIHYQRGGQVQALRIRRACLVRGVVHLSTKDIGLADHEVRLLAVLHGGEVIESQNAIVQRVSHVKVRRGDAVIEHR